MRLPEGFICEFEGLEEGLQAPPSVSLRLNPGKGVSPADGSSKVPWCSHGIYLDSRPQFTFDPAMHQGLYYVQDASSMIYNRILSQLVGSEPVNYLDACAAPGGKTTAAIDALPSGSLVVANEYMFQRAEILAENIIKWGYPRCIVTRGDTARFRKTGAIFDIIAADVPCSGEGMFRKDPEAVAQWTPALVEECAAKQREIVENLWRALRPGGYLIYSTCTFNRTENEDMAAFILSNFDAEAVGLDFPEEWGIISRDNCHHFIPGKVKGEGLTVAVFRKNGDYDNRNTATAASKKKAKKETVKIPDDVKNWVKDSDRFKFTIADDKLIAAMPSREADTVASTCDVIYNGIEVATIKGKDFIPSQALALSTALNVGAFNTAEVDYATAISYLRRETIILEDSPRGFILLLYKGKPLGFVKNLGNRANNLYPQNWRVLSAHVPDHEPGII